MKAELMLSDAVEYILEIFERKKNIHKGFN